MSPIREQGTYMFLSAITYFWPHVYFRDNKNLFEDREIMYEKQQIRGKRDFWKNGDSGKKTQGEMPFPGVRSFFRKGGFAGTVVGMRRHEAFFQQKRSVRGLSCIDDFRGCGRHAKGYVRR